MNIFVFALSQLRLVFFVFFTFFACFPLPAFSADLEQQTITMYAPYAQFSLSNASYTGNPFDQEAKALFTHHASGEQIATGMFYDGDATWKFRFTGIRTGLWNFITTSKNPELDGHTGSVTVLPNPDSSTEGFLTHRGNQFAIQKGNDAHLEGYSFTIFMNHKLGREKRWLLNQLSTDLQAAAKAWRRICFKV